MDLETCKGDNSCPGFAEVVYGTNRRLAVFPDFSVHVNRCCAPEIAAN